MYRRAKRAMALSLPQPEHPVHHSSVVNALSRRKVVLASAIGQLATRAEELAEVATRLVEVLKSGHKVLVAGNGGSAAEAQHFAAELVGRFKRERAPYPVLALTTDSSILTAVANDYGFQDVFVRQIDAFGQVGDLFLAFSTSGESENLLRAARVAAEKELTVVAVTGERQSSLEQLADITVRVPVVETDTAQELHMIVTHILCDIAEVQLSA
ncbi:D-sedoheptulose 7-phosphate isomerase [Thermosporothrix hazakensis]|jgi:D-sedoheptulose 7-phosphate isomerase|uniref:D-sedoheptulose 7-phosphate isomerase n=3 Tax=Thermosporothrix TaxID=768650 RepID=A0A326U347_THEHA|nr:D-sedoheptulose 7-phosphate isomerase [Thermosporothrix hazakensis]BBH90674.1 phosphoheptose isomerase [Thermosporothrix sp. COM3]GCE48725.1 phosphoheptose isomerase [Thermosporothrix hazakensis]